VSIRGIVGTSHRRVARRPPAYRSRQRRLSSHSTLLLVCARTALPLRPEIATTTAAAVETHTRLSGTRLRDHRHQLPCPQYPCDIAGASMCLLTAVGLSTRLPGDSVTRRRVGRRRSFVKPWVSMAVTSTALTPVVTGVFDVLSTETWTARHPRPHGRLHPLVPLHRCTHTMTMMNRVCERVVDEEQNTHAGVCPPVLQPAIAVHPSTRTANDSVAVRSVASAAKVDTVAATAAATTTASLRRRCRVRSWTRSSHQARRQRSVCDDSFVLHVPLLRT
jgi:hypothetical protein